jgi:hypothetical protein
MPPLFAICAADPRVTALLGEGPVCLFPFDDAPQVGARPYAVYQVLTGVPEDYVDDRPDLGSWIMQIDVYADTGAEATSVREALQYAIETQAHITRIGGTGTERETKLKIISLDVSWLVKHLVPAAINEWLLFNGAWDDGGAWSDTDAWNDGAVTNWILLTGLWSDSGAWSDSEAWGDGDVTNWILLSGFWSDGGEWHDNQEWIDG